MGITDGAKSVAGKAAKGTKLAASKVAGATGAVAVGYWRGLTYPFKGLKFVFFKHPGLVRFWMVPILITGIFLACTTWAGWHSYEGITNAIWADPTAQVDHKASQGASTQKPKRNKHIRDVTDHDWVDTSGHYLHATFGILILLTLWLLGVVMAMFLSNIFAAPFNDFLSEEVERLETGQEGPPFSWAALTRDSLRTIGLEVLKLSIYLVVMGPLFIISNLVPVIGHALYSIFGFVFTAMYFAIDYIDWPASRKNRNVTYRFSLLTHHFMPMFGFGSGVWLFLFIPLVNLLFMPAAVAGGTLLFLDLERENG